MRPSSLSLGRRLLRAAPLLALVLLPLLALTLLAGWLVQDQARLVRQQAAALQREHGARLGEQVVRRLDEHGAALRPRLLTAPGDAEGLRELRRSLPGVSGLLVLDERGRVLYPPPEGPRSRGEDALLERTRPLWEQGGLPARAQAMAGEGAVVDHAWVPFYHAGGLHLLLLVRIPAGWVAAELGRVRLLAEAMAALPSGSGPEPEVSAGGAEGPGEDARPSGVGAGPWALRDANGVIVYSWGRDAPQDVSALGALRVALPSPLGAWSLSAGPPDARRLDGATRGLSLGLGAGLLALAAALVGLAAWLQRERTRERRLAAQRVGFVGQVSHELKTPLTNIRLYAELLHEEADLESDEAPEAADRAAQLGIIVAETRRLGRLIANLLGFARGEAGELRLQLRPGQLDDALRGTLLSFAPALQGASVRVELDAQATAPVMLDVDAVEQILANLLSNVLKYAASGGVVSVESRQQGDRSVLRVSDQGPGVPRAQRGHIFLPFARGSDRLDEGVSGTGIGLDIARRLARLHGGDLQLTDSDAGACFVCTLHTPPAAPVRPEGEHAHPGS